LLDLVFYNFTDRSVIYDAHLLVSTVTQHPPFVTEVQLAIRKSNQSSNISFKNTLLVITNCYTTPFQPIIGLPSTVSPLLTADHKSR